MVVLKPNISRMKEGKTTILIIDDDATDRAIYKTYLDDKPFYHDIEFIESKNGRDGIKKFSEIKPDCVLLDFLLPDLNGIDVLKALREIDTTSAIIMLTGHGSEEIAVDTILGGAQDYIAKNTVTSDSLRRSVMNAIERAALMDRVTHQNEELLISKEKAERADKAKSEFLATMSHEIRTPLNGIIGIADLLAYSSLDDKQQKYVDSIRSSGELLLTIINDILDFSRIEAMQFELDSKPVHLEDIMCEVIQLLSSRAAENRVELVLKWPSHESIPMILTDPVRLRQVLINLIGNAIKFTRDGYVLINIERVTGKENPLRLRFSIQDTGIGIPEEKLDKIFDKFVQVDSSTTREYGGTGLGLTICKHLVGMMGGKISVESRLGKGSTFSFEIDAEIDQDDAFALETNYHDFFNGKKILIVDDYPLNTSIFSNYLKDTGALIETAPSALDGLGKLGIAYVSGAPFDLVLSDYTMPHMDGESFCRKITEHPDLYGTPQKILITGLGKKRNHETLKGSGISSCLYKPLFPRTLLDGIAKTLFGDAEDTEETHHTEQSFKKLPAYDAHILIVDDDRIGQRMAKSALSELSCRFDCAGDGAEAIKMLKKGAARYDLIFMDWQMPGMDGHEAIRRIRAEDWGRSLKIIALTANAIQGDREKCLAVGADDYISKPLRMNDMIRILDKYLTRRILTAA